MPSTPPDTTPDTTPDITPDTTDDELMQRAKRRVGMKLGFYTHALVFVLVNLGLFFINNLSGGYRWSFFPLWGWGLGLAIHGVATFMALSADGLRERMLAGEVQRLRRQG